MVTLTCWIYFQIYLNVTKPLHKDSTSAFMFLSGGCSTQLSQQGADVVPRVSPKKKKSTKTLCVVWVSTLASSSDLWCHPRWWWYRRLDLVWRVLFRLKVDTREDQMAIGHLLLNRQSHMMPSSLGRCPEGSRTRVNQWLGSRKTGFHTYKLESKIHNLKFLAISKLFCCSCFALARKKVMDH